MMIYLNMSDGTPEESLSTIIFSWSEVFLNLRAIIIACHAAVLSITIIEEKRFVSLCNQVIHCPWVPLNFQPVSSDSSLNCIKGLQAQIDLCITIKMHPKKTNSKVHKVKKKISWKNLDK